MKRTTIGAALIIVLGAAATPSTAVAQVSQTCKQCIWEGGFPYCSYGNPTGYYICFTPSQWHCGWGLECEQLAVNSIGPAGEARSEFEGWDGGVSQLAVGLSVDRSVDGGSYLRAPCGPRILARLYRETAAVRLRETTRSLRV